MATVLSVIGWVLGTLLSVIYWIASTLFWMIVWFFLPLAIVAFVTLRVAENVLGQERVRAWVKARSMKFGGLAWERARRLTFAFGVLPVRVLGWFVLYTIWHSVVSLVWRPRWNPWKRAWAKRWRAKKTTRSGRAVKAG